MSEIKFNSYYVFKTEKERAEFIANHNSFDFFECETIKIDNDFYYTVTFYDFYSLAGNSGKDWEGWAESYDEVELDDMNACLNL